MKILAFGASNSRKSINKIFADYVANQLISNEIHVADLNDYELPLYSIDYESDNGLPENAIRFNEKIQQSDVIIISFAEHNGSYTVAFKNLFDWLSRVELKMFTNKKLILLSTAPGPRGGVGALEHAISRFPHHGGEIVGSFTLPQFKTNFHPDLGIVDENLKKELLSILSKIA